MAVNATLRAQDAVNVAFTDMAPAIRNNANNGKAPNQEARGFTISERMTGIEPAYSAWEPG